MNDFLVEKRLTEENPNLRELASESAFLLQRMLKSYTAVFVDFTDHSMIHSLNVLDYCNRLIGRKQAAMLNGDECYVLIMACYLHDIGMGINRNDYERFADMLGLDEYFHTHDRVDLKKVIRDHHHEFSGIFTQEYADLFEIPSQEHLNAIVHVVRGHRKTDLFDETEYSDIQLANGNLIHVAYLASILRLADEIDVAADRVPRMLYDTSQLTRPEDIKAFGTHHAIESVDIGEDAIILYVSDNSEGYLKHVADLAEKISETLRYCASVCRQRTPFLIRQDRVDIKGLPPGGAEPE